MINMEIKENYNTKSKWVSLPGIVWMHYFAYLCHVNNLDSVSGNSVFFHRVVFLSTLYHSIASIKSLHPLTDQREGLSVSLLIPSLQFDTIFKWGQPSFSPPTWKTPIILPWKIKLLIIAVPNPLSCKCVILSTCLHESLNSSCMHPMPLPQTVFRLDLPKHTRSPCVVNLSQY